MNIPFSPPDMGEEEIQEVINTIQSGWITTGPKTKEFENQLAKYCHTEKAVCLNSATACLEMTLRLLGVGPGDEVITSAYTYTASCSPILHVGAKPVLVDVAKDSYEMDYEQLKDAITERTKVIIPVDIAGVMCDYDTVFKVINETKHLFHPNSDIQRTFNRIIVVADAAHAFGAQRYGLMCGEVADFTAFSFHAVKNLTTAEGGAVTWRNHEGIDHEAIYKEFQILSLHGQTKDALNKMKLGAWEYDILSPAYKCNMTDVVAGIGLAQLRRYEGMMDRRHAIIKKYNDAFKGLNVQVLHHQGEQHRSSGHLYLLRVDGISHEQRCEIIERMAQAGIACNVHYKPLPLLTAYKKLGFRIEDFPNAYAQYENEITLPLRSNLADEEVKYIITKFREVSI